MDIQNFNPERMFKQLPNLLRNNIKVEWKHIEINEININDVMLELTQNNVSNIKVIKLKDKHYVLYARVK